jgi:hypothetical protein
MIRSSWLHPSWSHLPRIRERAIAAHWSVWFDLEGTYEQVVTFLEMYRMHRRFGHNDIDYVEVAKRCGLTPKNHVKQFWLRWWPRMVVFPPRHGFTATEVEYMQRPWAQ